MRLIESMINNYEAKKISIITPSYQQGHFIEDTIKSVLNQHYPYLEYIIIDGGSVDQTLDVIKKYESEISYWASEKDKGQSHAINKGWRKSTGQIISWLNSDDLYLNDTLKFVIDYFNNYPKCDVLVGACQRIDENGKKLDSIKRIKEFDLNSIIYNYNSLPQPSVFFKKSLIKNYGLLNNNLHYSMDTELFLRFWFNNAEIHFIPNKILSYERWHSKQKSRNLFLSRKEKACVMHKYFEEYLGGRWTNLFKMILYNRKLSLKRNGMIKCFHGFPNGQEQSMINYFSEMFFL